MKKEVAITLTEILNSDLPFTTKCEIFQWLYFNNRITGKQYNDLKNILTDIKEKP